MVDDAINASPVLSKFKKDSESTEQAIKRKLDETDAACSEWLRGRLKRTNGHIFDRRAALNELAEVYRQHLEKLSKDELASVLSAYMATANLSRYL